MTRRILAVALIGIALVWSIFALPVMIEHDLGRPVDEQPGWPEGLAKLLNREGRVYGYWCNGTDRFCYAGDAEAFNEFVEGYARLKDTPLIVILHAGREEGGDENHRIPYDWLVHVEFETWPTGERVCEVILELWVGGQVELDKVNVPLNVKVKSGREIERFIAEHEEKRKQAEASSGEPAAGFSES